MTAPGNKGSPPPRTAGDPDDIEPQSGWDDQTITPGKAHYPYEKFLALDRRIRMAFLVSLLPAAGYIGLCLAALKAGSFQCDEIVVPLLITSTHACRLVNGTLAKLIAAAGYLITMLTATMLMKQQWPTAAGMAGLACMGLAVVGAMGWAVEAWLRGRLRDLYPPAEVELLAGGLLTWRAMRQWVEMHREADQAEESLDWGKPPKSP